MISRVLRTQTLRTVGRGFSGGHVKEYDWRDDPKHNADLVYNPRNFDWKPENYTTPYSSGPDAWYFNVREHDNSDLTVVRAPENRRVGQRNLMSVADTV